MKRQLKSYSLIFYIGIVVFAAGLILKVLFADADGIMMKLPFTMVGFGTGIILVGAVSSYIRRRLKNNPEKAKQLEIEEKDERNIQIREKAAYLAWSVDIAVLSVLVMIFNLIGDNTALGLASGALLIHIVSYFIFIKIFNKKF